MNVVIKPNLKVKINGIIPHRMIIGTSIVTPNSLQGTIIPVGRTFTVPVCPQTEEEIAVSSLQGDGLYCNPNLTIDEVISLLEKVFENNSYDDGYVVCHYTFDNTNISVSITKSDTGFTVTLMTMGLNDILIENSQFTETYQELVIASAQEAGTPVNFIRYLMYMTVQNTEPLIFTSETNVGEHNDLLKDWISYKPFTQAEGTKIALSGEYDGSDINVTKNGTVDIEGMIAENKIPLKVNVEIASGDSWESVVDECVLVGEGDYEYIATNGIDRYSSYSGNSNKGVWHTNLKTGVITKINSSFSNLAYFFEDSKGEIYASGNSYCNGIFYLKDNTITQIYTKSYEWTDFFEDSKGNVYAKNDLGMNQATGKGLLHLNKTEVTVIGSSDYWHMPVEDSKGNTYASNGSKQIYLLNGNSATQIGEGYINYFFEDSKGNVYGCGNGMFSILNGETTTLISNEISGNSFFEDSKGNVYLSGLSKGIFYINNNDFTVTKIYDTGTSFEYFFEDSKGNVYCAGGNSSEGILHLTKTASVLIYDKGTQWRFFEDSKGNIYAGDKKSESGLLHIDNNNNTVTAINTGGKYEIFFEDSKGNVYTGGNTNNYTKLYHLNGTIGTSLLSSNYGYYKCFKIFEKNNKVYVFNTEKPDTNAICYELDGATAISIKYIEEE